MVCVYPSNKKYIWELSFEIRLFWSETQKKTPTFIGQVRVQICYSYRMRQRVYSLQSAAVWGAVWYSCSLSCNSNCISLSNSNCNCPNCNCFRLICICLTSRRTLFDDSFMYILYVDGVCNHIKCSISLAFYMFPSKKCWIIAIHIWTWLQTCKKINLWWNSWWSFVSLHDNPPFLEKLEESFLERFIRLWWELGANSRLLNSTLANSKFLFLWSP